MQTRMIYENLLSARVNAVYQRRGVALRLYRNRFEVYSSSADSSAGAAPVQSLALALPTVSNSKSGDAMKGYPLGFDARGLSTNVCTVCLDNSDGSGGVDSIVISDLRIRIGKKDKGDDCKAENITTY
jgi:hypothetical protein